MSKTDENLEALMDKALKADNLAYNKVLNAIAALIRPYISKRLSNQNEIEDLVQEVLISIHKARHTYNSDRPLKPWVFAIARHRLADYLRNHYANNLQFMENLDYVSDIPADLQQEAFTYESIKKDVLELPGKQPMILHLIHSQGYTSREVAAKMKMSESAVKVSAHRAYKILRKKLANE